MEAETNSRRIAFAFLVAGALALLVALSLLLQAERGRSNLIEKAVCRKNPRRENLPSRAEPVVRKPEAVADIQPPATETEAEPPFSGTQIETARHIMNFIRTGEMDEIRDLPREDVEELVEVSPPKSTENRKKIPAALLIF